LTDQTYTGFGDYGMPKVLLIETQFTDILLQDESIFSDRQKQNILSTMIAVILDMVPNQPPRKTEQKARHFNSYECLNGNKPYQFNKYTPTDFKNLFDNHKIGERTLLEIFDKDNVLTSILYELKILEEEESPLYKRTKDTQTLLSTFFKRGDHQMIKLFAPILLQSTSSWKARDLIMSDLFEIFKKEEMLANY
jgi:hypothetical protein